MSTPSNPSEPNPEGVSTRLVVRSWGRTLEYDVVWNRAGVMRLREASGSLLEACVACLETKQKLFRCERVDEADEWATFTCPGCFTAYPVDRAEDADPGS
jgi:hypothetical protein